MEYLIGLILALAVVALVTVTGLERDRAFYPTVLIVVASYYVLFASMADLTHAVVVESIAAGGFTLIAILGFKKNLWLVALAIAGHGLFDLVHSRLINNPGVPNWWPGFCMAFDVTVGCFLGVRLRRRGLLP
jgi:hypothetical protein